MIVNHTEINEDQFRLNNTRKFGISLKIIVFTKNVHSELEVACEYSALSSLLAVRARAILVGVVRKQPGCFVGPWE